MEKTAQLILKNQLLESEENLQDNLVLMYKGPFLEEILGKLSEIIRGAFTTDSVISRKLLGIFIEMAQNVFFYSADSIQIGDKMYGIGSVSVTKAEDKFIFTTGNLVPNHYVEELISGCNHINSLNKDELRKLKRDTRSGDPGERSKGAGIGLIQVALTAGEPIEFETVPHDSEKTFFFLTATINN